MDRTNGSRWIVESKRNRGHKFGGYIGLIWEYLTKISILKELIKFFKTKIAKKFTKIISQNFQFLILKSYYLS